MCLVMYSGLCAVVYHAVLYMNCVVLCYIVLHTVVYKDLVRTSCNCVLTSLPGEPERPCSPDSPREP